MAKIGSHPSYGYSFVEQISSASSLGSGDSGKLFMVDQSSAFTINLPKLSSSIAGWQAKFVIQTADSNDVHIMAYGLTSSGGTGDSGATNDGDTVIQLPCDHIFHPESIKTWLKEESSKCPVCRHELKFNEIKDDIQNG